MNFDSINELATKFGVYQILLIATIWWGNIVMVGSLIFMVFGAAEQSNCVNATFGNGTYVRPDPSFLGINRNDSLVCVDRKYVFYSFVPEYNLENNKWTLPMITSVQQAGALIGSLVGGQIADIFGRKLNTWFWISALTVFAPLSILSTSLPLLTAFRFFIGLATGGYLSSSVILVMEWMNAKTRLPVQLTLDMTQSFGFIWLSLVAYLTRDWKNLSLILGLQGIPLVIAFWFLMDPPIWLFQKRKFDELLNTMKVVGKLNRKPKLRTISDNVFFDLHPESETGQLEKMVKSTYLALFSSKKLIQYSLMNIYSFFITGTIAYLLIFNVGNLVGNIFLNLALLGTVNICAAVITMIAQHVLKLGRRPIHQGFIDKTYFNF